MTKDKANCNARADVKVDDTVIVKDAPVTFLLFLEKQLNDLKTFVGKIPTLSSDEDWTFDANANLYKTQSILYGLLIKDNYNIVVKKGYIVYTRSKNHIEEIIFNEKDITHTVAIVNDILKIMELNYFPKATTSKRRCIDCCYHNICVK